MPLRELKREIFLMVIYILQSQWRLLIIWFDVLERTIAPRLQFLDEKKSILFSIAIIAR